MDNGILLRLTIDENTRGSRFFVRDAAGQLRSGGPYTITLAGRRAVSAPDTPDRSPSLLAGPPKRGLGVRRLNKLPIVFAAGGAMLVAAAIGYTYRDRLMRSAASARTGRVSTGRSRATGPRC